MIDLNVPGRGVIQSEYTVSDGNGTMALDGQLIEGVANRLNDRPGLHHFTDDLAVPDIHAALELLKYAMRLVAILNR